MLTSIAILVVAFLVSYLLGAIPFGYVAGRLKGIDIRQRGSKNVGATNVARVVGRPAGIAVLMLDVAKGLVPVLVVAPLFQRFSPGVSLLNIKVLCGLGAIVGHIFTIFLKFRGGKGVATGCGVLLALDWPALLVSLGVWILVVAVWRYVSLGSIVAIGVYPVSTVVLHQGELRASAFLILFALAVACLVIARHKSNVKRLLAGTESKITGRKPAAEPTSRES